MSAKHNKHRKEKAAHSTTYSDSEKRLASKVLALGMCSKILHPKGLRELATKLTAGTSKGWSLVGAKDDKTEVGADVAVYREALASVYGNKPVPFVIPLSQTSTTSGSVLAPVYQINISAAPEWTSLSALFDEWQPLHGKFQFNAQYAAIPVLSGNACMLALGFDPSDGTAATTVREVAELKQHQLYRPVTSIGPTGTVVGTSFFTKGESTPLNFSYTMKGVQNESFTAAGIIEIQSGYRPTKTTGNTAALCIGYVKHYAEVASPAAGVALAGIWYHTINLRSRT